MKRVIVNVLVALILTILSSITSPRVSAQVLPSFEVVGRDFTSLSIVVPSNTTKEQLKALILGFREARKNNSFRKMNIQPTTPRGKKGDYGIVMIFVFTEPEWASEDKLKKSAKVPSDDPFYKEYSKHIKAYYYYAVAPIGAPPNLEEGSIGYAENGRIFTPTYEKIF